MLDKLLKYETKATARILLPLYLVLLAYAAIHKLISVLSPNRWQAPEVISFILYIMILVGIFVVTLVIIIQRFYKNLLTDEGYLMFTLPTKTWKHITSKLLVSMLWSVVSGIVGIISVLIIVYEDFFTAETMNAISKGFNELFQYFHASGVIFIIEGLVAIIVGLACNILLVYASVAVGHLFNKHRILASLGAFVAISTVTQILATILSILPMNLLLPYFKTLDDVNMHINSIEQLARVSTFIHSFMWIMIIAVALVSAAYFAITNYVLSRRLNLE